MATISDLPNPHFLSLSKSQRMELILSLRAARRSVIRQDPTTKDALPISQLKKLTSTQISKLLELLDDAGQNR